MKKFYIKKLLSLIMLIAILFPVIVSASSDIKIKSVYFQDESGNMVFVDYEYAIDQSMEGDYILYNAIKHYVGIAESKGRAVYLETNTDKVLDYRLAMIDNLFKLSEIIGNIKYEVNHKIEFTHELKVVDGVAVIVEKKEVDPPEEPVIVRINQVNDITVKNGTPEAEAIRQLQGTTTMEDSKGRTHIVDLDWTIINYNGEIEGEYRAIGRFTLPEGISNGNGLPLKVEAKVIVLEKDPIPEPEEWPKEVENVFIGKSQITNNTYANIEIKGEYVSKVEAVYVDNILANKMEEQPSQWRIQVEDGTTAENLKGRIKVTAEEVPLPEFDVEIDKDEYNIDEEIRLTGVVSKEDIELENIDITYKVEGEEGTILVEQLITVKDGKFSSSFQMPADLIEGKYKIVVKCHGPINKTIEINFIVTK